MDILPHNSQAIANYRPQSNRTLSVSPLCGHFPLHGLSICAHRKTLTQLVNSTSTPSFFFPRWYRNNRFLGLTLSIEILHQWQRTWTCPKTLSTSPQSPPPTMNHKGRLLLLLRRHRMRRLVGGREIRGTGGTRGTWIDPRTAVITMTETCRRLRRRETETGSTSAVAVPALPHTATVATPLLAAHLRLSSARGEGAPAGVMDQTTGKRVDVFSLFW